MVFWAIWTDIQTTELMTNRHSATHQSTLNSA